MLILPKVAFVTSFGLQKTAPVMHGSSRSQASGATYVEFVHRVSQKAVA